MNAFCQETYGMPYADYIASNADTPTTIGDVLARYMAHLTSTHPYNEVPFIDFVGTPMTQMKAATRISEHRSKSVEPPSTSCRALDGPSPPARTIPTCRWWSGTPQGFSTTQSTLPWR